MVDFTKNLNTHQDFTQALDKAVENMQPEDRMLGQNSATMMTAFAQEVFEDDSIAVTTKNEAKEYNGILKRDIEQTAHEADIEALSEMIANGSIKQPQQASVLLRALEDDKEPVGENTALVSVALDKTYAKAVDEGDIVDPAEYTEARERLSQQYSVTPQDISAKQAVIQQVLAEIEEEQSNVAATGAFIAGLVPGVEAVRSYKGTLSETGWGFLTNRTYEDVLASDELLMNPNVSAEDVYNFLQEYRAQHDPETAKQKLRSILNRSIRLDHLFWGVDVKDVGGVVAAATTGAAVAVPIALATGASLKATTKGIAKEGAIAAGKAFIKEIPGATSVVHSVTDITKNPKKILKLGGRRNKFADEIAQGIPKAAFENPKVSKKIIEEAVDSAASPRLTIEDTTQVANKPVVSSAKEAAAIRAKTQERMFARAGKLQEMSNTELAQLQRQAAENFSISHPKAKIDFADLEQFEVTPLRDTKQSGKTVYRFRHKIGTGANNSDAFATREAAEQYARSLNIKGASEFRRGIYGKDKTGWWIYVDTESTDSLADLTAQAFESQAVARGLQTTETAGKGKARGLVGGVSTRSTVERRLSTLAAHERDNVMLPLLLDAHRSIKNLSKADGVLFDTVVDYSRRNRKWVSTEWLRERGASEKLINAYANYRAINDLDYIVANKELARELSERGAREVFFDGKRQGYEFLKKTDLDETGSLDSLWFKVDGEDAPRQLTADEYKALRKKGYVFTETLYSSGDIPAKRIRKAYNPDRFSDRAIRQSDAISEYVPGGRYKYSDDNVFIKQLEVSVGTPTKTGSGRKYISGVHTITAGTSIDKANEFARLLESARQTWIRFRNQDISAQQATLQLQKGLGTKVAWGGNIQSLDDWMTGHHISLDPEAAIEAVRDGERLKSYEKIMSGSVAEDLIDSNEAFRRSASSLYTSEQTILKRLRSGGDIEEIFEGFTPVRANPEEEIKRLVNDITNMTTMKAYTEMYKENFQRVYGSVIRDLNGKPMILDRSILKTKKEVSDPDLLAAATNSLKQYETIRGTTNDFDDAMLEIMDGVLRTLHVSEDGIQKVHDAKLLSTARRVESFFTFAFAPQQLLRQAMGIVSTHLLNPIASAQADMLMFLYPIFKDGTPKMIEAGLKTVGLEGLSENLSTFFKNVDILRSRGTYYEAGVIEGGLSMSRTFTKVGYLPYITGESVNRVHSSIVSLLSSSPNSFLGSTAATLRNKYGRVSLDDVDAAELAELLNRYQVYYRNMDAVGKAPIQNSQVYQTVLQFQSYRLKWWETLFDTELTKTQKGAFILGNLLLYGANGNSLGNVTSGWFSDDTAAGRAFNDGFLNYAMESVFGDREFLPDLNELGSASPFDIFGYGLQLGENLTEMPLLRSSSQVVNSVSRIVDRAIALYRDPEYTFETFLNDMRLLTTSSDNPFLGPARAARAAEALMTGYLYNARGVLSAGGMDDLNTALFALGFNNLRDSQMWRKIQEVGREKENINAIVKELTPFYLDLIRNPDSDKARQAWRVAAKLYTSSLSHQANVEVNRGLSRELRNKDKTALEKFKEAEVRRAGYEPREKIIK